MANEYDHLTLTDRQQFVVLIDSINEQNRNHLNQTKLADRVAVSIVFNFPDSKHKWAMASLDCAKRRSRYYYKVFLRRFVEVCRDIL